MPKFPSDKFIKMYFGFLVVAAITLTVAVDVYTGYRGNLEVLFGTIGMGSLLFLVRLLFSSGSHESD